MSILKVARMGHPVLRERARPLDKGELRDRFVQKLIDDMIDTMREYSGVGLAAPQVHESLRLFVALNEKYGLEMDFDSVEKLAKTHGLVTAASEETAAY